MKKITKKIDFTKRKAVQDMLCIMQREKNISVEQAILDSINEKICQQILDVGWASIALNLWAHDDPERKWDELENKIVQIDLPEDKYALVKKVMNKEKIYAPDAISYFILFTMEDMGYHI